MSVCLSLCRMKPEADRRRLHGSVHKGTWLMRGGVSAQNPPGAVCIRVAPSFSVLFECEKYTARTPVRHLFLLVQCHIGLCHCMVVCCVVSVHVHCRRGLG